MRGMIQCSKCGQQHTIFESCKEAAERLHRIAQQGAQMHPEKAKIMKELETDRMRLSLEIAAARDVLAIVRIAVATGERIEPTAEWKIALVTWDRARKEVNRAKALMRGLPEEIWQAIEQADVDTDEDGESTVPV